MLPLPAPISPLLLLLPSLQLGLTNIDIYIYHRLADPVASAALSASLGALRLPCNMRLIVRQLLPNLGREATVFLHHILAHYDDMPRALYFVHDHGPAARHSLCGPFYRRVRGFYRGIVADERGGKPDSRAAVFQRFANRTITLSSGCIEAWAKGCCAMFMCSSSPGICPWEGSTCAVPGNPSRFLHMWYNYDVRHENQIIGAGDVEASMALLRYTSTKTAGQTGMWNLTFEYGAVDTPASIANSAVRLVRLQHVALDVVEQGDRAHAVQGRMCHTINGMWVGLF